jgi:glycosyltransferase involved in cell wall biosynthesis
MRRSFWAGRCRRLKNRGRRFPNGVEIVVCDNNSTDRTAEIARAGGARVVFEPLNQIARARNTGAAAATGDWLVFIDADSIPNTGIFRAVARNIESGRCIGGGCLVELDERGIRYADILVAGWNFVSRAMRWAAGSFVYCEARAFRELGGFSTKLFASEEIEFSQRLKRLARGRKLKMMIVREPKLLTSARKMHLYKPREFLWFFARAFFMPWRVLTRREQCGPWYDGRR